MNPTRVALVSGANRGIGLAICQHLAATFSTPLTLYAVSRSGADLGLHPSRSSTVIKYGQLDIRNPSSVDKMVERVKQEVGGCDVLINNAGIYHYTDPSEEQNREMLEVNWRGTLRMCEAFLPIMNPKGRIVNVSSANGELRFWSSEALKAMLRDPGITVADLDGMARHYEAASNNGTARQHGFPAKTYGFTKSLITTLSMALARENPGVQINACCPGWCGTELGDQAGIPPKTSEEGARVPLRLAFGDIGDTTGVYWANEEIWQKGEGGVRVW